MTKALKKNWITILLILIPVVGLIVAGIYFGNKNKKNKRTPFGKNSLPTSGGTPELTEETLFSDPSTFIDNAKKYPSKYKKFIRNLKKQTYEVGDSVIQDPKLREIWHNMVEYWLIEVNVKQNKPNFGLEDWLADMADSPLSSLTTGLLWNWQDEFNKGNTKSIISRAEARALLEKVGADPYTNWLRGFPEQPVVDNANSQNQQKQIVN